MRELEGYDRFNSVSARVFPSAPHRTPSPMPTFKLPPIQKSHIVLVLSLLLNLLGGTGTLPPLLGGDAPACPPCPPANAAPGSAPPASGAALP